MKLRPINDEFAVTEQITVADVEALAAQGIKGLLCNRPDAEAPDQPAYADIEAAARRLGMSVRSVPVVASQISAGDVQAFSNAYAELPRPLVAWCRTGTRSITLWAMDQSAKGMAAQEILEVARNAGYDLSETVRKLESQKTDPNEGHPTP